GNRYDSGLRGYMDPDDDNCFSIWDLGGAYSRLEATCIIRAKDRGSRRTGSFRIYGDGVLLYERTQIDSMTKPFPVWVDLTGVTDLKIEMYGGGNMGSHGISSVLVDVMLYR
ncbi:MAG: NPCBM/NEW2 domain-containing protein, partial [Clostridia bacterium]|nr:NPCBM/NEW2 domain-containing protein [Clostridia bacterium]